MKVTQPERILAALREGPKTNVWMVEHHIFAYTARITELRQAGHNIIGTHKKGGVWEYRLEEDK